MKKDRGAKTPPISKLLLYLIYNNVSDFGGLLAPPKVLKYKNIKQNIKIYRD